MARQVGGAESLNQVETFQRGMRGENNIVNSRHTKRELRLLLWAIIFVGDDKVAFVDNTPTTVGDTLTVVDNTGTTVGDTLTVVDNTANTVGDTLTVVDNTATTVGDTLTVVDKSQCRGQYTYCCGQYANCFR